MAIALCELADKPQHDPLTASQHELLLLGMPTLRQHEHDMELRQLAIAHAGDEGFDEGLGCKILVLDIDSMLRLVDRATQELLDMKVVVLDAGSTERDAGTTQG